MAVAEIPSEASRTAAVAVAGMGADGTPPTAISSSEMATDPEKGEHGGVTPSGSSDGTGSKHEKAVDVPDEPQRSKGKTALIMLALCVNPHK